MTLPYDIARCANGNCDMRDKCRRAEPGRPDGSQVFSGFPGGKDCDGFWPVSDGAEE